MTRLLHLLEGTDGQLSLKRILVVVFSVHFLFTLNETEAFLIAGLMGINALTNYQERKLDREVGD